VDELNRPTGTITFLFSDMEGSTELAAALGTAVFREILELHQRCLREAFERNGGIERSTEGDSFFVVFRDAPSAVAAAVRAQQSLAEQAWPENASVRVRMGIHTGEGQAGGDDYVGLDVNRAARIAAAGHGGQVLVSETTRALAIASLPDGVAVRDIGQHRLKGLPEPEHLYQLTIAGLVSDFPAIRSLDATMTNLPARTSSFVGRDRAIGEITRLIGESRLVTLVGPGGTGKTSLATEVSRRIAADFNDGVWFVALDALADPGLVGSAIVAGLGLRDISGRSARERLLDNLPGRSLLLVIDNFEHVVEAAPLIGELLLAAPNVRAIVTSRAPLRLSSEQIYPVPPLDVPDPASSLDLADIASIPAVRLFVERARRVQPDFTLTTANAEAIADICRRLDGLPLGIELAAARIAMLGPAGIRDRLAHHLALGGAAARDVPARQRTLDETIGWSHDLLDDSGRALFAKLAVFAGGWRLTEAEEVCADGGNLNGEVADLLDGLVEQSLVTINTREDGVRYGMLETIRQHAAQRLAKSDPDHELQRRHALTFLALAERTAPGLETHDAVSAISRLQEERDNLGSAIRFAVNSGDADVGLRLGRALYRFWGLTGDIREGIDAIQAVLSLPGAEARTALRLRALEALGNLFYYAGDSEEPPRLYRAQLELARELNDEKALADARYNLLFTDFGPGESEAALAELDAIEAHYRALGDERARARTMWARGVRLVGSGRAADAVGILEMAIVRYRELGDYGYLSQTAGLLSWAYFQLGDPQAGTRWLLEGITFGYGLSHLPAITAGLPQIAMATFHLGLPDVAATILGAYDGLTRKYGVRMPENLKHYLEASDPPEQVRSTLDADTYDKARSRGLEMGIDEVIEYINEVLGTQPASSPSQAGPTQEIASAT
jgi:predicted ATPase/class 3 adenylate cyclase